MEVPCPLTAILVDMAIKVRHLTGRFWFSLRSALKLCVDISFLLVLER